jgi:hypothetical protein
LRRRRRRRWWWWLRIRQRWLLSIVIRRRISGRIIIITIRIVRRGSYSSTFRVCSSAVRQTVLSRTG